MRPVLLELNGFGSFREPATVDFRDADFFALVGATGAGKSTVIDAMTFALYRSAPRWDSLSSVAPALAPTANRGTVRLVFDVGSARYVVARELRRAPSGSVSVKSSRLERLADPLSTGGPDETVHQLAADSEVDAAVEALLGLTFRNFCTCVVLPQGDFAEFLHAKPADRQRILSHLLGLEVYEAIGREARSEAQSKAARAELLTEQLGGLADATSEALEAAVARVRALRGLADRIEAGRPAVAAASAARDEAMTLGLRLAGERSALAAVAAPSGLASVVSRHAAAVSSAAEAVQAADAAEAVELAARDALDAAPARGPLEQAVRDHRSLAEAVAAQPGARAASDAAASSLRTAAAGAESLRGELDRVRAARTAAVEACTAARTRLDELAAERDRLAGLAAPSGLDLLGRRLSEADASLTAAVRALSEAEAVDEAARLALSSAPARLPLEQARRDHAALAEVLSEQTAARSVLDAAAARASAASAALTRAEATVDTARQDRDEADRADQVGLLRAHLTAGAPCPVCEQPVKRLPADTLAPDRHSVTEVLAAVERARDAARTDRDSADRDAARAETAADALDKRAAQLQAALGDRTAAETTAALAELDRLDEVRQRADAALRAARAAHTAADRTRSELAAEREAALAGLRTARDPFVGLGAPPPADDPLAGWTALLTWAKEAMAARDGELAAARTAAADARTAADSAEKALAAAGQEAETARAAETSAARAEQAAADEVARLDRTAAELADRLAGAPTASDAAAELSRVDELAAAARQAADAARTARRTSAEARRTADAAAAEVEAARTGLRTAWAGLVQYGAPELADADVAAGWAGLVSWAHAEADSRTVAVDAARERVMTARAELDRTAADLAEQLRVHEVPAPADVLAGAAQAADRAMAAAEADQARTEERLAQAAGVVAQIAEAESDQQVAKLLGDLMKVNQFQSWLTDSALRTLLAEASVNLLTLSGGQFELSADGKGVLYVVDHADADARRPVKTLSGGETFQASLALALALSSQLPGMAAGGAARLDSIFLDEGFGTLDESSLDTVAATLENLAGTDRMVGLVTHVSTLAERVPVRFTVARDQRTSSITREG